MNLYKPHSITFPTTPSATDIFQISSWTPTPGFAQFVEYASSGPAPLFTGTHSSTPMVDFSTPDIEAILGMLDVTYALYAGFTSEVSLAYLKKANLGVNGGIADAANLRINLANSQLSFEGLSAQQNQLASIACKLKGVDGGSGCLSVETSAADLSAASAVNQFGLGPVSVNGSTICASGISVSNNIQHDTQFCSGGSEPEYTAIDFFTPAVAIQTEEIDETMGFFTSPGSLSALTFYLRKKTNGGLNVANATAEHIKFAATVGDVTRTGEKEITVRTRSSLAITLSSAIT